MVLIACSFGYADTISVASQPGAISVAGSLSDPNDVIEYTFDVTSLGTVSFQTLSYGGGTSAVTATGTVSPGGFEIGELALYENGQEITAPFTQGTGCPPAGVDSLGACGDAAGSTTLGPGIYTLALMTSGNSPIDFTLSDGFSGTGGFYTNDGSTPSANYEVDITGNVAPVPEPATLALLGSGLLLASIKLRKRASSVECEASNEQPISQ